MKTQFGVLCVVSMIGVSAFSETSKTRGVATQALSTAGNGIYSIAVDGDGPSDTCGAWTAVTGSIHPAGAGLNVLYGGGSPSTSNTILRSYTSGRNYATGEDGANCGRMCTAAGAPVTTPILSGSAVVGQRQTWKFQDGANGPNIEFIQEITVVGPTNGSETIDNTVVRETHTVRNVGTIPFSFGLRKQWDWQIKGDDGPYFGDCASPKVACNRSMNLTADGSQNGSYPATYVINQDPVVTGCPNNVQPTTTGCTGAPPYLVAGTVAPPSTLYPPPTAPELLQFGSWKALIGSCWLPALVDAGKCGSQGSGNDDDTAVAYFYGLTQQTAITIGPGQERSFTQYVAAAPEGCPAIVSEPPGDPCCPPWNSSKLEDMLFYEGSGSIADLYTLEFHPTPAFLSQIQAYIDYLSTLNPAMSAITIHFRVNDAGNGANPTGGPQIGADHWVTWNAGGNGAPQPPPNFFTLGSEPMQINRWYRIHTGIYLENGQAYFDGSCANNDVDVRIQVQPHALQPILQMRKATGPIVERPLPMRR